LDSQQLRDVFAQVPGGVVVVATRDARGFRGLTASSFAPVSVEPALVLVSLDRFSASLEAMAAARSFNVSLLGRHQEFLADRFSGRAPAVDPEWHDVAHRLGENGLPIVAGGAAWFECSLQARHVAGDHEIVIGAVHDAGTGDTEPLLHWRRGFWSVG
jgi:flavin reductase ActVB